MITDAAENIISIIAVGGFVGLLICIAIIFALIGLFFFVIWIIALVDCARRKPNEFPDGMKNAKTFWLVILIAAFFITQLEGIVAIVYYFLVMKKMPIKK